VPVHSFKNVITFSPRQDLINCGERRRRRGRLRSLLGYYNSMQRREPQLHTPALLRVPVLNRTMCSNQSQNANRLKTHLMSRLPQDTSAECIIYLWLSAQSNSEIKVVYLQSFSDSFTPFKSSRAFRRLVTSFSMRRIWLRCNFVVAAVFWYRLSSRMLLSRALKSALVLAATFAISAQSLLVHALLRSSVFAINSLRSSCAVVRASWRGDGGGLWATAGTRNSGIPFGILVGIGMAEAREFRDSCLVGFMLKRCWVVRL
jgi:hypothetical protein